jgi:hypothetical protein
MNDGDCPMASGLLQHADSLAQEAPNDERYWAHATPGTSAAEGMTEGDFAAEFKREPFEAIRTLCVFVEFGLVTKSHATRWLFPLLIKARGDLREHIYETLVRLEEPGTILITALAEYDKYGNEERLALAASLLADIGEPALPVLRMLIRSGHPECGMFLPVIARLHGVSTQQRLEILVHAASHPSPDVRYNLLQALRTFTLHEAEPLLRTLSRDQDTEIADEARARLESLKTES